MALDLKARISLDGSGFESGLRKISTNLKSLAAGAFGFAAVQQIIHKTIDRMEELGNASERLGVGVEFLQEMGYAARQTGSDMEKVTKFLEMLNVSRADANKAGSFRALGVNNPGSGTVQDLVKQISAGMQGKNAGSYIGALREVGGRSAGELNAAIKSLDELSAAAHDVGAIIEAKTIAAVKVAKDEMQTLADVMMTQLAPAIAYAMEAMSKWINAIKASGTFWGTVMGDTTEGGHPIKDFIGAIFGGDEEATKRSYNRMNRAGAASATEQETLDASTDALIKALTDRLKNPLPPSAPFTPPARSTKANADIYSNDLRAVGNFLGSSKSTIQLIAEQTNVWLEAIDKKMADVVKNTGNNGVGVSPT